MPFITEDFLLETETARRLYYDYASDLPIIDYHCHLPPADVAKNRRFDNLFAAWLEGDHYKWRLMRTNGVPERLCTGDASDKEKFLAFARTVPETLRNPMYHWCHLELKRYFGIDRLLNEHSAEEIWDQANARLAEPELSAHGILSHFKVSVVCTTDDPTDDLAHHKAVAKSGIGTRMYPTFRPDKALAVDNAVAFNAWVTKLEEASGIDCTEFGGFLDALRQRHDYFHEQGGRLSDHGIEHCFATFPSRSQAASIFDNVRSGETASAVNKNLFASYMMEYFGGLDAEKGWTKQLHLGALRGNNTRLLRQLGPDIGCDAIGDFPQGKSLVHYLDRLDSADKLPKMVLYNLNPRDNYLFASIIGSFQDGQTPGKIQFGSGWWFNDQIEGMTWQINALSNLGLLSRFVGMLTDSRSFLSYCRHEYFRRLLCNLLGNDVEKGLLPADDQLLGNLVTRVCYENAARFFGLELGDYRPV